MSLIVSQLEIQDWDNGRVSGHPECREGLERHWHVEKVEFLGVGEIVEDRYRGKREVNTWVFGRACTWEEEKEENQAEKRKSHLIGEHPREERI